MAWVTFECRGMIGMPAGIGSNIKDENYVAQPEAGAGANSRSGRAGVRECRQTEPPMACSELNLRGGPPLVGRAQISNRSYCLVPVKVPSPNCPSETLPLIVLPSVLPEYFTARLPA